MCNVADIKNTRLEEADDILTPDAVTGAGDIDTAHGLAHRSEDLVDDGLDVRRQMVLHPGQDVEVGIAVHRHGISLKEVGHHGEVTVGSELVNKELVMHGIVTHEIG